jgi:hypothetical protein
MAHQQIDDSQPTTTVRYGRRIILAVAAVGALVATFLGFSAAASQADARCTMTPPVETAEQRALYPALDHDSWQVGWSFVPFGFECIYQDTGSTEPATVLHIGVPPF